MSTDLIVLSHLRWTSTWQRPHHIVSRLARSRRTWFVEEPTAGAVDAPRAALHRHGDVTRTWIELPAGYPGRGLLDPATTRRQLAELIGPADGERIVWMTTPLAHEAASHLDARVLVYDATDDLLSPDGVALDVATAQKAALTAADVVLTGSPSLHRRVIEHGRPDAYLVPDGVDPAHFATARSRRRPHPRPVAAHIGPIDGRLDRDLLAALAHHLADWDIWMVGALDGIDGAGLPQAPNLGYLGPQPYADLPDLMAGVDVAIVPLSIAAADRSTGATTTLEYLAAGLPVVATPVPDVVTQFGTLVDVQDDAAAFAGACVAALHQDARRRQQRVAPLLRRRHWDTVVDEVTAILRDAGSRPRLEDLLT